MTQYERMIKGLVYDPNDPQIQAIQRPLQDRLWSFNQFKPSDLKEKEAYMKEVFASCGENCYIELPLRANWGGHNVHFGDNVYANSNLTLVDDGQIFSGNNVMFGPNVTIATANHPIDPELRLKGYQYNRDVYIEDNVWIGAGVTIVPGVRIGKNSVIGANSLVSKDIPENVVAYGVPCKVVRQISERDHEFFYRNEKVDYDNL